MAKRFVPRLRRLYGNSGFRRRADAIDGRSRGRQDRDHVRRGAVVALPPGAHCRCAQGAWRGGLAHHGRERPGRASVYVGGERRGWKALLRSLARLVRLARLPVRIRAFGRLPARRKRWRLYRSCPYNGVSEPTFLKTVPHWQNQTISTRSARKNWKRRKSRKKSASASWIARRNRRPARAPRRPSPAKRRRPPESSSPAALRLRQTLTVRTARLRDRALSDQDRANNRNPCR